MTSIDNCNYQYSTYLLGFSLVVSEILPFLKQFKNKNGIIHLIFDLLKKSGEITTKIKKLENIEIDEEIEILTDEEIDDI